MNCVNIDNSIVLQKFGTKLFIKQCNPKIKKSLAEKQIELINGRSHREFFAIFDSDDVDFEIWCDNRECDRGIGIDLTLNKSTHKFYIRPRKLCSIKALRTNGKKLHFIRQSPLEGDVLVAKIAKKYGISYAEASSHCSKIEFRIEVEECVSKGINRSLNTSDVRLVGNKIRVSIEVLFNDQELNASEKYGNKKLFFKIGSHNTVNDLKVIINKRLGIPIFNQQIIYDCKRLADHRQLAYYNITDQSTLFLYPILKGGGERLPITEIAERVSNSSDIRESDSNDKSEQNNDESNSNVSKLDKIVVCYGQKSREKFTNYYDFAADSELTVNSFVIEMRVKPRYEPI